MHSFLRSVRGAERFACEMSLLHATPQPPTHWSYVTMQSASPSLSVAQRILSPSIYLNCVAPWSPVARLAGTWRAWHINSGKRLRTDCRTVQWTVHNASSASSGEQRKHRMPHTVYACVAPIAGRTLCPRWSAAPCSPLRSRRPGPAHLACRTCVAFLAAFALRARRPPLTGRPRIALRALCARRTLQPGRALLTGAACRPVGAVLPESPRLGVDGVVYDH